MRKELASGNRSVFSRELREKTVYEDCISGSGSIIRRYLRMSTMKIKKGDNSQSDRRKR